MSDKPRCLNCGIELFRQDDQWWHPNPCLVDCAVAMISFDWHQPA